MSSPLTRRFVSEPFPQQLVSPFGRVRVADVYTHADIVNTYRIDPFDWSVVTANGGTVEHLPNESAILLSVTGSNGSRALLRTREAFRYQAGKALCPIFTVAHGEAGNTNQIRRWGYWDDADGYFFQLSGTNLSLVLRSSTSGSVVDTEIAQANWNVRRLETLDLTTINIYEMVWSWLGAGGVQAFVNEELVNDDDRTATQPSPFTRTAQLPLSFEIVNVGPSEPGSMKHVCGSVLSDGGDDPPFHSFVHQMPTEVSVGTTEVPLFTLRAGSLFNGITNRRVLLPTGMEFQSEFARSSFGLVWNASLTGATFAVTPDADSSAQVDVAATSLSGGTNLGRVTVPASDARNRDLKDVFAHNGRRLRGGSNDTLTVTGLCEQASVATVRGWLLWREVK